MMLFGCLFCVLDSLFVGLVAQSLMFFVCVETGRYG